MENSSHGRSRLLAWFESLLQDMRYAARALKHYPGVMLGIVATLAICIALNTTVFTVTNAVLFQGFRFVDNDRMVYIRSQDTSRAQDYGYGVSYPDFLDWRNESKTFSAMSVYTGQRVSLSDSSGYPQVYYRSEVSASCFSMVQVAPLLGRDFLPSDEQPGASPVAILSHRLWSARYGQDPGVVGRTIRVNGTPTTVIGVMPEGVAFPVESFLWTPFVPTPAQQRRDVRPVYLVFGRLADGVTVSQARSELDTIARRLQIANPTTNAGIVPLMMNFRQFFAGSRLTTSYVFLWGAVAFLMLIACANLSNLMLARAVGRSREIAVRAALGAKRWRITQQLVVESLMLAGIAAIVGGWLATWATHVYVLMAWPGLKPYYFTMTYTILMYVVAISAGAGLLIGLVPALRLSQVAGDGLTRSGNRGSTVDPRSRRMFNVIVMAEMALAVMLLSGVGVMARSFLNVYDPDLGVRTANVLTAQIALPVSRHPDAQAQLGFYDSLLTRLAALPGAEAVAIANAFPGGGSPGPLAYEVTGAAATSPQQRSLVPVMIVDDGYFRTLGASLLAGRAFERSDRGDGRPVAIVNERFANQQWPGEEAVGRQLRLFEGSEPGAWRTVVGVTSNIVQKFLTQSDSWNGGIEPLVYVAYGQRPTPAMTAFVRSPLPPSSLIPAVRREVQALDPDLGISVRSLEDSLALTHSDSRTSTVLLLVLGTMGLLLASIGLYSVMAHTVRLRTRELGIRMALGAPGRAVVVLILKQGGMLVGVGLAIGLVAAFLITPVLRVVLTQVSPTDPATFAAASGILIAASMLGCLIPARRATRIDPVVALREE